MKRWDIAPLIAVFAVLVAGFVPGRSLAAVQGEAEGAATETRVLTPRDVARIRSVGEVAMSPDGSAIAYTLIVPRAPGGDEDGAAWTELHRVSFDGSDDRPLVAGRANVSHLRWSPDGRYLAYLARRAGDDHRAIYLIPADVGESLRLYQHATNIEAFDWRPDGRAIAFVAEEEVPAELEELRARGFDQEIYEEDWANRRLYVLELPQGTGDPAGAVRTIDTPGQPWHVVWGPDGRRLLTDLSPTPLIDDRYMYRRLHVIDASTGALLNRIENPGKLGTFRWSPDGKTVVLVSGADIHDPREGLLLSVRAEGGGGGEGGEFHYILPGLDGHVSDFSFLPNGRIVYLADVGVGSRLGRVRVDGRNDEVLYEGTDPVLDALSIDALGRSVALVAESPTMPAEVHALSLERRGAPVRLTDVNPWLSEIALGQQEIVRWPAPDGTEIEGLLIHPVERAEGEPVPLVVVAHGGPESHYKNGWLTRYNVPGQMSAGRGYAVFYPNYRGSTGRGVAFAKADQGDGMGAEFDDVLAGIDAQIERGLADPEKVAMTGGSYGGYFTAWAATRHSERFAAGVMLYGVSDQLSKTGTSDITNELELVHWLTTPYTDLELFLERSPVLHVEDAQTPLLILHGLEDARVYPGQSLEMYRALKVKGDVPVRAVFYPGEGHGFRRAAARYDCSVRMLRWLDHFVKEGRRELPPWRVEYELGGGG